MSATRVNSTLVLIGNPATHTISLTLHACARENTSLPLCRAKKFNYVTPDLLRVTCDSCLSMLGAMREETDTAEVHRESGGASQRGVQEVRGLEVATGMSPANRLYFCVIDRFCYETRAYGLLHMRLQHGITNQETYLLRERLAGGPF